jgi:hypothetical protein
MVLDLLNHLQLIGYDICVITMTISTIVVVVVIVVVNTSAIVVVSRIAGIDNFMFDRSLNDMVAGLDGQRGLL